MLIFFATASVLPSQDEAGTDDCSTIIGKIKASYETVRLALRPTRIQEIKLSLPTESQSKATGSSESDTSRAPQPKSHLRAANHNTDNPPPPGQVVEVLADMHLSGIDRFASQRLHSLNPNTGDWTQSKISTAAPVSILPGFQMKHIIERPNHTQGLWVPQGFRPIVGHHADATVTQDQFGHYRVLSAKSEVEIPIERIIQEELTASDRKIYIDMPSVDQTRLPSWLSKVIEDAKSQEISDSQIAEFITSAISKNMIYKVDANGDIGIYSMLEKNLCQCTGSATIAASILRNIFKIPTRIVAGRLAYEDSLNPGHSVVKNPDQNHAWIEIYDRKLKRWIPYDPTPLQTDREKKNDSKDSRFKKSNPGENANKVENNSSPPPASPEAPHLDAENQEWLNALDQYEKQQGVALAIESSIQSHSIPANKIGVAQRLLEDLSDVEGGYQSTFALASEAANIDLYPNKEAKLLKNLRTIQFILEEIKSLRKPSDKEQQVLEVLQLIEKNSRTDHVSPEDIGKWLLSQLVGPLSRAEIERIYYEPSTRVWNWHQLASDLAVGRLDDILLQIAMKPFLNIWMQREVKAHETQSPASVFAPITDQDPLLDRADDDFDFRFVHRDGPAHLDLMRAISGDLMVWKYPDEETTHGPQSFRPRLLSNYLLDMSGSMKEDDRYLFRNALALAYLDESQIIVAAGHGEHEVNIIPYENRPWPPISIQSLSDAQTYYSGARRKPPSHHVSNNLSNALKKAFDLANDAHKRETNPFQRINNVAITDGDETIDMAAIAEARAALPLDLSIWFNAVTLVVGNSNIQKLADDSRNGSTPPVGSVTAHHLSLSDFSRLKLRVKELRKFKEVPMASATAVSKLSRDETRRLSENLKLIRGGQTP